MPSERASERKMNKHKELWPYLFIVLVMLIFVLIMLIMWRKNDGVNRLSFNSTTWKNTPSIHSLDSMRLRMVEDLLKTHSILGKSKEEMVALIGEPDQTKYFKSSEMVYMLGQETDSYFAIDAQWLVLELNDSERVASYDIVTD